MELQEHQKQGSVSDFIFEKHKIIETSPQTTFDVASISSKFNLNGVTQCSEELQNRAFSLR